MKLVSTASRFGFAVRTALRLGFALLGLCFVPAQADAGSIFAAGSASTSITSLIFNDDGTIAIEADQIGSLSGFGSFTGHFSYRAYPSANALLLVGTGTLINSRGEKLFLTATILELGADYPLIITGTLRITSGTGRFAEARGSLIVNGRDEESLTDQLFLHGLIVIPDVTFPMDPAF